MTNASVNTLALAAHHAIKRTQRRQREREKAEKNNPVADAI